MSTTYRNLIDGEWVDARSGKRFTSTSPANHDQVIGEFPSSGPVDVDAAVAAAKRAFRDWSLMPAPKRGEILGEIALVDGGPRTATVTLDEPSRLLVLSRNAFRSLMDEFPSVREAVLETLAERVRGLDRDAYN